MNSYFYEHMLSGHVLSESSIFAETIEVNNAHSGVLANSQET